MKEIWKPVAEYYKVSNTGKIRRAIWLNGAKRVGRSLGYTLQNGYREVCFFDEDHNRKTRLVHQVVTGAFLGPCPEGKEINHKDGNKRNNYLDNLEYVTPSENIRHAVATGLMVPARGSKVGSSKLSNRQVRRIRFRHKNGATMADISRRLKIGLTTVSDIIYRRTWTHI